MRIEDHDEVIDRHAVKYARPISAWTAVEEVAFGGAMGSNGYLAPDEAGVLLAALALPGPGRVLDVGTGRGWPAWVLAREGGHSVFGVVAADLCKVCLTRNRMPPPGQPRHPPGV